MLSTLPTRLTSLRAGVHSDKLSNCHYQVDRPNDSLPGNTPVQWQSGKSHPLRKVPVPKKAHIQTCSRDCHWHRHRGRWQGKEGHLKISRGEMLMALKHQKTNVVLMVKFMNRKWKKNQCIIPIPNHVVVCLKGILRSIESEGYFFQTHIYVTNVFEPFSIS